MEVMNFDKWRPWANCTFSLWANFTAFKWADIFCSGVSCRNLCQNPWRPLLWPQRICSKNSPAMSAHLPYRRLCRPDQGSYRVISPEMKDAILASRQKRRLLSAMLFYETLIAEGILSPDKVSYHTVYRLLKSKNSLPILIPPAHARAFL